MKKLILLSLFLASFNTYAQQYLAAAKIDGRWGGAWGYIDTTGKWVIEPKFQEASAFSEGFAKVKYSGRFGFIDKKGNWIAKPIYEEARDFNNGLAKVLGSDWGFIDTTGSVFLKTDYLNVTYFSSGFAKVKKASGWCMVDSSGKELKTVDFKSCESFKEGLARVEVNEKFGFIDPSGELVIKPIFEGAGNFSNGLAWARIDGKVGYIDKKGNFRIEPKYKKVKDFSDNLARVFVNNCWSFLDTTGKEVITLDKKIELVSVFTNGFARIQSGGVGYINTKGNIVIPPKYIVAKNFNSGVAVVRDRGDFILIDTTGSVVTKNDFAMLDVCDNGFVRARAIRGQWGFVDKTGTWLIKPTFLELGMFVNVDERYKRSYRGFSSPFSNINDFR